MSLQIKWPEVYVEDIDELNLLRPKVTFITQISTYDIFRYYSRYPFTLYLFQALFVSSNCHANNS